MTALLLTALAALGLAALLAWLGILLHPARPWDVRPVAEDEPEAADPVRWPAVVALVPARNEAASLARTLPALLDQDYPGSFRVVLIDDRSTDGTGEAARRAASASGHPERLEVVTGRALPAGWAGKVHALEQGLAHARQQAPTRVLLTDADILHAPHSLRRLVAEAERDGLALTSRMARLSCTSLAERLIVPPFVWFFALLYPPRQVNDPLHGTAAAAGGCILLDVAALEATGGFAGIRDRVIDDVSLARQVKGPGRPIRLAFSRGDVTSLRPYPTLAPLWRMVRRSAFTQLGQSWTRLALCLVLLALTFLAPAFTLLAGTAHLLVHGSDPRAWIAAGTGLAASVLMACVFRPAGRLLGLPALWSLTLPLAAALFGLMTLDSGLRHARGRGEAWRDSCTLEA